ncbi:MAG: GntR family transcriptional regulator [Clostridium sp.]|nr:GntR family transcriptional regulator [Clostridium sp.]
MSGNNFVFSSDDVYDILRREILTLTIEPGALLSENTISTRFGISRTPTRSVIERLRSEGMIQVIPKKGSFVSLIDLDLSEQIIYMRIQSELAVMTQLTKNPTFELLSLLEDNLKQQEKLLEGIVIREEFYRLDSGFHELCMQAVGKRKLWEMIQHMDVHYSRYRYMDYKLSNQQDVYPSLCRQHRELFNAIRDRNTYSLKCLLTSHLYSGLLRIGTKLVAEYGHYFENTGRTINEILLDVKMLIQASQDELSDFEKKGLIK